jgi:hypothetical protein
MGIQKNMHFVYVCVCVCVCVWVGVCVWVCGCAWVVGVLHVLFPSIQVREVHSLVDAVAKLAVHCVAGNPRARPSARVLVALLESALLTHGVPLHLPGSKPVAPIDDIGEAAWGGVGGGGGSFVWARGWIVE